MASPSSTLSAPPPPPGNDAAGGPGAGTPPASPARPSPAISSGTQMVISIVNQLRALAKAYPSAAPKVAEVNDKMREISVEIMKEQQPGEPQAGPGG